MDSEYEKLFADGMQDCLTKIANAYQYRLMRALYDSLDNEIAGKIDTGIIAYCRELILQRG